VLAEKFAEADLIGGVDIAQVKRFAGFKEITTAEFPGEFSCGDGAGHFDHLFLHQETKIANEQAISFPNWAGDGVWTGEDLSKPGGWQLGEIVQRRRESFCFQRGSGKQKAAS